MFKIRIKLIKQIIFKQNEIMQKLPKGFRWVEVRNDNNAAWTKRILAPSIGDGYQCVNMRDEASLLRWEQYSTVSWKEMKEAQEPKKTPYTAETFPMWAIWIRCKGCKDYIASTHSIQSDCIEIINKRDVLISEGTTSQYGGQQIEYKDMDKYEIAGTDGEWKPFYQLTKTK